MARTVLTPDEAFKEFTRRVGEVLRGHGFRGSGQNFRRDMGEQWHALNLQKSQWRVSGDDPIVFYVNVGVHFPRIEVERFYPTPTTIAKFTAGKADQTLRIDDLFLDMSLDWFGVDGGTLETFWPRFSDLLSARLVPQLETMATPQGLASVFRTMPWMMSLGTRVFVGPKLATPVWDPKDKDAGLWKQDSEGLWWGPGEWSGGGPAR